MIAIFRDRKGFTKTFHIIEPKPEFVLPVRFRPQECANEILDPFAPYFTGKEKTDENRDIFRYAGKETLQGIEVFLYDEVI